MYLETLISGGSVNSLTGTLISALMSGEPKEYVLDLFIRAAKNQLTPEQFDPDLSILPSGVFPGQKMFYIHVESLNLGIC